MEIIRCLEENDVVKRYDVLAFEVFESGFYIRIKVLLVDDSELFIREYSDVDERNYSYHWQDARKQILMRWDNAGHHKHIETYPHHVHDGNHIFPSYQISCKEVLTIIEGKIKV